LLLSGSCGIAAGLLPRCVLAARQPRRGCYSLSETRSSIARTTVSLRTATARLRAALRDLKKLARDLERPRAIDRRTSRALDAPAEPVWTLALDEIRDTGVELRPRLPFNGPRDFTGPERRPKASGVPLSEVLKPMKLDPLTVADDEDFLAQIAAQPNVPNPIKQELAQLY
jgi:5-methylthioadenosine/S-adenosylhomocysteine deaminase